MPPSLQEYEQLFNSCTINPGRVSEVNGIVANLLHNKQRYINVAETLNSKMPWWFIAVIHTMECSMNFNKHLHNGDPLTARTIHVPADRPVTGKPPFTWEQSAIDALKMKNLHLVSDWSISNMLWLLEKYNGMGYRNKGINSPYLWSYTNQYTKGKYGSDNHYDPNLVSKQCGAAAIIKSFQDKAVL